MMNLTEYRHPARRLSAMGRAGRLRRRLEQRRLISEDGEVSRSRSGFRRRRRAGRRRRAHQQRRAPSRLRLEHLRGGAAKRSRYLSRQHLSRSRVGAGRCRAQGRFRGSGRAFRVRLLPDLPLAAPGRGSRSHRGMALRGPRENGRGPRGSCYAPSSTAPTACWRCSTVSCRNLAGSMTPAR